MFDGVLVELARQVARGVIEGLMDRYPPEILANHVARNTDLVTEGLRSPDARDRATMDHLRRMAAKYRRLRGRIEATVTPEWFMSPSRWIWRQAKYAAYYRILNTPQGRAWLSKNLRGAIDYFFSPP